MFLASLDRFFPPSLTKPKQDPAIFVEERCADPACRKILKIRDIKYTLRIRGKEGVYCQECAKRILRPQERSEADL